MSRRYNEEHREEINQYMRVYRVANADYIARRQRLRYEENKQLYAENQRWIREERTKRELSQDAVAFSVDVSQATIARLESGALPLDTFGKRDKLFKVLGVGE